MDEALDNQLSNMLSGLTLKVQNTTPNDLLNAFASLGIAPQQIMNSPVIPDVEMAVNQAIVKVVSLKESFVQSAHKVPIDVIPNINLCKFVLSEDMPAPWNIPRGTKFDIGKYQEQVDPVAERAYILSNKGKGKLVSKLKEEYRIILNRPYYLACYIPMSSITKKLRGAYLIENYGTFAIKLPYDNGTKFELYMGDIDCLVNNSTTSGKIRKPTQGYYEAPYKRKEGGDMVLGFGKKRRIRRKLKPLTKGKLITKRLGKYILIKRRNKVRTFKVHMVKKKKPDKHKYCKIKVDKVVYYFIKPKKGKNTVKLIKKNS